MRLVFPAGPSRTEGPGVYACGPPAALTFPTVQLTMFKPIYPQAWLSPGRKESNPQPLVLETRALPLSYVPMKGETALQDVLGAVPSHQRPRRYVSTIRPVAPSMRFEHRAGCPLCSKLGDQVCTVFSS